MDGVILLQVKSNQDFYIKKLIDRKESNMSTSIKVKVLDRNTLELSEDAKAGDFIELDKIESLDTGFITDLISKERETYVKKQIDEELKKQAHSFELEKQKLLAEQENKLHKENQEKIDNFNKKIAELTSNNKIEIEKLIHEHEKRETELQTKIKQNWDPPKGTESKRVVVLFKIAKDGRLISHLIYKSSGSQAIDKAALHAIELTAPFTPLPPEYNGDSVDVKFTFDYNMFKEN